MNEKDLKKLSILELKQVAKDCREKIEEVCHANGGHLGGNLGVVELTLAWQIVFDIRTDKIIFDVGHQSYTHKLLTGRGNKALFMSLRKKGGLSGFMCPAESTADPCMTGHAGNSISMALGFSYDEKVIANKSWITAVIGDGSLLNGMAVEALNHLAITKQKVLIIINDNQFSIDKCVGVVAAKHRYKEFCKSFALPWQEVKNGNDLKEMIVALKKIKRKNEGPQVLYVPTEKGHGDAQACLQPEKTHFCASDESKKNKIIKLQDIVGEMIYTLGENNPTMTVVTPAMTQGGGLQKFADAYPQRFFDVGIAEAHAVAFAGALALANKKSLIHIYASFLQRAYDQLIHDIMLNQAPVTLLIDRWGMVGEDGITHQGHLALAMLKSIPNLQIFLPGSVGELKTCLKWGIEKKRAVAIGYPKISWMKEKKQKPIAGESLTMKKLRSGKTKNLAVITTGFMRQTVEKIENGDWTHFHFPQVQPLMEKELKEILENYQKIIIVEENEKTGGFGEAIAVLLTELQLPKPPKLIIKSLENKFILQATRKEQLEEAGLDENSLAKLIRLQIP